MKHTHTILALFVTVLALPMAAVGQDEDASIEVASNSQAIDNITVEGRKSTSSLRQDYWRSEKDFYSRYNKLNDDSQFDVRCSYESEIGSRIRYQVCRPVFFTNALRKGDINHVTNLNANAAIAGEMATFREKLDTLISSDSELQDAANELNRARTQYVAAENEKKGSK